MREEKPQTWINETFMTYVFYMILLKTAKVWMLCKQMVKFDCTNTLRIIAYNIK